MSSPFDFWKKGNLYPLFG